MSINSFFIALLFFPFHVLAQQVRFEHITSEKGLSQSTINCMIQDKLGFLWVGTENGLNRFDGYQFIHYENQIGDTTSLSNNSIKALAEDREGFIWVGTLGGLNRFDPKNSSGCSPCPSTLSVNGIIASSTYQAAMDLTSEVRC